MKKGTIFIFFGGIAFMIVGLLFAQPGVLELLSV
jgi:hypothetical protein